MKYNHPIILFTLAVLLISSISTAAWAKLKPETVSHFFVTPNHSSVLTWKTSAGNKKLNYIITDYWNDKIASGQAKVDKHGLLSATVNLPRGYYTLAFPDRKQTFGIDSILPYTGKVDSFFSFDTSISWRIKDYNPKIWNWDKLRQQVIHVLHRAGIGTARDRLKVGVINPAHGKWNWEGDKDNAYDTLRGYFKKIGVPLLATVGGSPKYIGGSIGKYPENLLETSELWKKIAKRWRSSWDSIEIWNEPNSPAFSGNAPADQYVPLVSALGYIFHTQYPNLTVVGGVLSSGGLNHLKGAYLQSAAQCGLLNLIDALSFHDYNKPKNMQKRIKELRGILREFNRLHIPLWITEVGWPWGRGPDRPPMHQDQESALNIIDKAVEARVCGIARYFVFEYLSYEEGKHNFGTMGKMVTPLRSFAAYAYAVHTLANSTYIGDLKTNDSDIKQARVFATTSGHAVIVLYTGQMKKKAVVRLRLSPVQVCGIDGRKLKISQSGDIPVPDGLSYVYVNPASLHDHLEKHSEAMQLYKLASAKPRATENSPVIMQFFPDKKVTGITLNGYNIPSDISASVSPYPIHIHVTNLDDQSHSCEISACEQSDAKNLIILDKKSITVSGHGASDVTFKVYPYKNDHQKIFKHPMTLSIRAVAMDHGAMQIQPLQIKLFRQPSLADLLKSHPDHSPLPVGERDRWKRNAPRLAKTTMTTNKGVWRLNYHLAKAKTRWCYPYFYLPKSLNISSAVGMILRARCTRNANVNVFLWEHGGAAYVTKHQGKLLPTDGQWHNIYIPFSEFVVSKSHRPDPDHHLDLNTVRKISIGMNTNWPAKDNVLEISNCYVVYQ